MIDKNTKLGTKIVYKGADRPEADGWNLNSCDMKIGTIVEFVSIYSHKKTDDGVQIKHKNYGDWVFPLACFDYADKEYYKKEFEKISNNVF